MPARFQGDAPAAGLPSHRCTDREGQRCLYAHNVNVRSAPKGLNPSGRRSTLHSEKTVSDGTLRPRLPVAANGRKSQSSLFSDSAQKPQKRPVAPALCPPEQLTLAEEATTSWSPCALTDAALRRSEELLAGLDALGLSGDGDKKLNVPRFDSHESCLGTSMTPALWPDLDHTCTETAEVPIGLLNMLALNWVAASGSKSPTSASKQRWSQALEVVTKRDQGCQHECISNDVEEPSSPSNQSGISLVSTAASSLAHGFHRARRESVGSDVSESTESQAPSLKSLECQTSNPENLSQQGNLPVSARLSECQHINSEAFRIMSRLFHSRRGADALSHSSIMK